jgi:hypothetical protein
MWKKENVQELTFLQESWDLTACTGRSDTPKGRLAKNYVPLSAQWCEAEGILLELSVILFS